MKYSNLLNLVAQMEAIIGNQETKVQKKLFKIFEKVKPSYEAYQSKKDELRLDNASANDKGILNVTEKGDYQFTKEGIKKLTSDIKALNDEDFAFEKINIVNPQGLETFIFLEDWTNGIEFIKQDEEEL
jgi:hypothetical protein